MEKKIIELVKDDGGFQCILCCDAKATTKVKINRLKYDQTLNVFYVCDSCLSKMQKDIEICK